MKKKKTLESHNLRLIRRIAYHEAGHAVMNYLFETGIERVSIERDPIYSSFGNCLHKNEDLKKYEDLTPSEKDKQTKYIISSRIIMTLAGILAEHIYNGEPEKLKIRPGCNGDVEDFMTFLKAIKLTESKENLLIKNCKKMALDLLRTNWKKVEVLATALLEKRTISGEEVSKLLK